MRKFITAMGIFGIVMVVVCIVFIIINLIYNPEPLMITITTSMNTITFGLCGGLFLSYRKDF